MSSVYVKPEPLMVGSPEMPMRFLRFYVCLAPCKQGFIKGCRPIIGLDGCHLKGLYTGQVLTAVSKDGNENIFPLAFAVVERETKETWCWFLEILLNDIGTQAVTFMSDRQKGLIEAISLVAPRADTRVCVRHMHNNFKTQWPGKSFKDALWVAARATTTGQFESTMQVMKDLNEKAYKYLMNQHPSPWSLHAFKYYTKSDMLLNNACESFNSCILEARELPILSMCEWIRRKLMKMFISKRNKMRCHQGLVTPEACVKIKTAKTEALSRCRCVGDGNLFEVDCGPSRYVVDLLKKTCGCNIWELTGLPCPHAMCCILKKRLRVEDFVSHYYYTKTYLTAYDLNISPMPGADQWEKTNQPPLDPPKLVVQPGRQKKERRKGPGEDDKAKVTRVRHGKNKCGNCGEIGHTRKICKNPYKSPEPKQMYTRGRPLGDTTLPIHPQKRKYTKRKVKTAQSGHNQEVGSVGHLEVENDPDVKAMIEIAMIHEEVAMMPEEVAIIPTQQSQVSMSLGMGSSVIPSQETVMTNASSSRLKSIGLKKSPLKRSTRKKKPYAKAASGHDV